MSIPENCVGKTYARPQERMGILATPEVSVRYKIVSGDKDKHFKAEAKQVRNSSASVAPQTAACPLRVPWNFGVD